MFYEKLTAICAKKNLSLSAVALGIGISKSNVTEWKNGKYPSVENLLRIAKYLDVSPAQLMPSKRENNSI